MAQTQAALDQEINAFLPSGSGITAGQLRQVLHDMNAGIFQNGVTGFAVPTNFVGLTPNQGSLSTALRSDATLAISQAITPTWTGQHVFGNTTPASSANTGSLTVAGGVGIAQALYVGQNVFSGSSMYINNTPVHAAVRQTGTCSGSVSTQSYNLTLLNGATITGVTVYTTAGFGATGSVMLTAGTTAGDNQYIQAQNIKALGVVKLNLNGTNAQGLFSLPNVNPNFVITLTQSGSNSGAASSRRVPAFPLRSPAAPRGTTGW